MIHPVVIVGTGQMGAVFAHAFMRLGHPIYPVTRELVADDVATEVPSPEVVVVAVGEGDLEGALEQLPRAWHRRVALIQNELLPRDWERHGFTLPTVAAIWFEKKKNKPLHAIRPTPVAGPQAEVVANALRGLELPVDVITEGDPLLHALVEKNLYILTANIAGMVTGGTVGALWQEHRDLAEAVFDEVFALQQWLTAADLPKEPLRDAMVAAFEADPDHGATGRSAPKRLARAIAHAERAGIDVPKLREIAAAHSGS